MSLVDFENDVKNITSEFNKLGIGVLEFDFMSLFTVTNVYSDDLRYSCGNSTAYIKLDVSKYKLFTVSLVYYIKDIIDSYENFRWRKIGNEFTITNIWDDIRYSVENIESLNNEFKDLLYDIIYALKTSKDNVGYDTKTIDITLTERKLPTDSTVCDKCGSVMYPKLTTYTYHMHNPNYDNCKYTINIHNLIGYVCEKDNTTVYKKDEVSIIESIVDKETNKSLYKAMIDAEIRLGIARAGMRSISPNYQEINQYLDEVSELLSAR